MFDFVKSITYRIDIKDLRYMEFEIHKLEFDHKPATEMIEVIYNDGDRYFKYIYTLREEHNKWYFVAL